MIDVFTVGRTAAKYGYRKFGIPGAIIAGVGGAAGYRAVKGKAKTILERRAAATDTDETEVEPAGTTIDGSTSVDVPTGESGSDGDGGESGSADDDGSNAESGR